MERITERIEKRTKERDQLNAQLAEELNKQVIYTAPQVSNFLHSLKRGDINDINNRRGMINIFVRAIYLFDDTMMLVLNGGDRSITIDNILLDEIETYFETALSDKGKCSPLVASAPPIGPYSNPCLKARRWARTFSLLFGKRRFP